MPSLFWHTHFKTFFLPMKFGKNHSKPAWKAWTLLALLSPLAHTTGPYLALLGWLNGLGLTRPNWSLHWHFMSVQWILCICESNEPPGPWPFSNGFFYVPRLNPRFNVDAHHLAVSNTFETVQYYSSRFLWTIYSRMIVYLCLSLRRLHGWHQ